MLVAGRLNLQVWVSKKKSSTTFNQDGMLPSLMRPLERGNSQVLKPGQEVRGSENVPRVLVGGNSNILRIFTPTYLGK